MVLRHSVLSDSFDPMDREACHELKPARFLCPWDSAGRNTRVGCHFLLQGISQTQGTSCIGRWIFTSSAPGKLQWMLATAKSLQSCPTLCNPIDSSPPGSAVPGILQARTLEWVAISFSIAWKWKVKVKSLSRVQHSATPWTAAYQAPPSMGFSRQEYWSGGAIAFFEWVLTIIHLMVLALPFLAMTGDRL